MILASIAYLSILAGGQDKAPTVCPIMHSPANVKLAHTEYNGVAFYYCCAGCNTKFEADPKSALTKAVKDKVTIGVALFDPVNGTRVSSDSAKGGSSDFGGVKYYFVNAANKKTFDASPKKFASTPEKESLKCPVMGDVVEKYSDAAAFRDVDGVRYYICCAGCLPKMNADPAKYAKGKKGAAPKAIPISE